MIKRMHHFLFNNKYSTSVIMAALIYKLSLPKVLLLLLLSLGGKPIIINKLICIIIQSPY